MKRHIPVLLEETMNLLNIQPGAIIVDATVGHAGHSEAMLARAGASGSLFACDWDSGMLERARENLQSVAGNKTFINADFRSISSHIPTQADAVLMDFGVNWEHFEDSSRGFSFQANAQLDMRMDRSTKETAAAWLNRATHGQIASVLREYGGEKFAGKIAAEIVARRKSGAMKTTGDLVEAVMSAIPPRLREKRIHPATRTFQAIRIKVNEELEQLSETIIELAEKLRPGGRLATLSYHSGEDACAKHAMKSLEASHQFRILTKKPIVPSEREVSENPSSRSAKLRVIERTMEGQS